MSEGSDRPGAGAIDDGALVQLLLDRRLLTQEQLRKALRHASATGAPLPTALLDLELVAPDALERTRSGHGEPTEPPRGQPLPGNLDAIVASAVPSDLVEQLLLRALRTRTTDVHLDPREDSYSVRFRIDGQLHGLIVLDREVGAAVVRGIKNRAELNLVEQRLPQDGALSIREGGRSRSFRVATLPTARGEKVVLRLLEPIAVTFDLARLGLEAEQAEALERMLAKPSGAVLVGGPVGAGKTTTLYSCLERLNNPSLNVMTIEDPVECRFPAVNQVEIDTRIGLTFARGLRAILRQDPNILMIGEIRDDETAAIGMRAALTGVLVFSTIHAADAASTANSLRNYGVPGYTLANAVHGIVNQRLVRVLCPACKAAFEPEEELLLSLRLDPAEYRGRVLHRAVGCPACLGTGYHGRTAIFEVMEIGDLVRELMLLGTTKDVIRTVARDEGMRTLREGAMAKALRGETTIEEVYRVTA